MELVFLESQLIDEVPFTTSLVIAKCAEVEHRAVRQLINKYKSRLASMGKVTSKMSKINEGRGRKTKIYHLNEVQSTFVITLLKNTEKVVDFKEELSKQFFAMKNELTKRQVLKEMEKPIRKDLTNAIKNWCHFNQYSYNQITDLICKIITGKITRCLKKERGVEGKVSATELYSAEELEKYQKLEGQVISLLELGLTYGDMKEILLKKKVVNINEKQENYA